MPLPRVVIFDQFEEIFSSYQDRWKDREGFFEQVSAILESDPLLRVVFVMREDFIAQLDPYAYILPERLRTRFHMERLRSEAALQAVKEPLRYTGRSFAEGVAEKLVDDLLNIRVETTSGETAEVPGEFIEAVQLQVVCQNLWRELPPDVKQITFQHLKTYGNVEQELYRFYEESIRSAAEKAHIDEEGLRRLCGEVLITPMETRGMVYRAQEFTGGVPNEAIDVLESMHLIRAEWRAGARWYELTHDRFIEPILSSNKVFNDKLAEKKRAEKEREKKEQAEKEWVEKERLEKEQLEKERAERKRVEKELQVEKELAKSKRLIFRGFAAFLILILILTVIVALKWDDANYQKQRAEGQTTIALKEKQHAEEQTTIAEEKKQEAEAHRVIAEEKKQEAEKQKITAEGEKQRVEEQTKIAEDEKQHAEEQRKKAKRQKRLAEEKTKETHASRLNLPSTILQEDPNTLDLSVLLAIESFRVSRTLEAEQLIRQGLLLIPHKVVVLNHNGSVNKVVFSPDGKYVATASADNTSRVWDAATGKPIFSLLNHTDVVNNVVFSPDGKYVATASADNTSRLWDVGTGEQIFVLNHTSPVRKVVFSPDGKYAATASSDNTSRIWDVATGKQFIVLENSPGVYDVVFSPDRKYIATASWGTVDNTARIWDAATGKQISILRHNGSVNSVVFSPNEKYIATASNDNTARIWDAATGEQIFVLNHTSPVYKVIFSPDGKYIATASFDKTACLWDAATGEQIFVLKHDDNVRNIVFSPDGKYIATVSDDKTTCLWNVSAGELIFVPLKHDSWVLDVIFSPDGKYIATSSADKTARLWELKLWELNIEDLINESSSRLTRNLNREEWNKYMGDEPYHKTFPNLP